MGNPGRMRGLLIELIATHLGAHQPLLLPELIAVSHITGERDQLPQNQATATDLLRLLLGEEAINPNACMISRNTLDRIVGGAKDTIAAAVFR